jgi:hypothetical protein
MALQVLLPQRRRQQHLPSRTKKKNPPKLSDIEESRRNAVRSTRNGLPQPPAHVYIGNDPFKSTVRANVLLPCLPPFDGDIQPLDHTSPHKYPTSFVAAAACAASSPANTLEDEDEAFNDLEIGEGLDDLSYSSAKDDEDYDDNMEKTARQIEYSDRNGVSHGRRQTSIIPGGPKPPKYDGMNDVEKAMAKREYKRERKKITDGLRLKRLKDQNDNFDPEEFSGCLTLGLRTMVDVQNGRLEVNHTFPDKEILVLLLPKRPTYEGSTLFVHEVICVISNVMGPDFVYLLITRSVKDGLSLLPTFVSVMSLEETSWMWTLCRQSFLCLFGRSGLYH